MGFSIFWAFRRTIPIIARAAVAGRGPGANRAVRIFLIQGDMAIIMMQNARHRTGAAALCMRFRGSATRKPTAGFILPAKPSPKAASAGIGSPDRYSEPMASRYHGAPARPHAGCGGNFFRNKLQSRIIQKSLLV